jgi:hypothetical protein
MIMGLNWFIEYGAGVYDNTWVFFLISNKFYKKV